MVMLYNWYGLCLYVWYGDVCTIGMGDVCTLFGKFYSCAMFVEMVDDCRVRRCLHSLVKFYS